MNKLVLHFWCLSNIMLHIHFFCHGCVCCASSFSQLASWLAIILFHMTSKECLLSCSLCSHHKTDFLIVNNDQNWGAQIKCTVCEILPLGGSHSKQKCNMVSPDQHCPSLLFTSCLNYRLCSVKMAPFKGIFTKTKPKLLFFQSIINSINTFLTLRKKCTEKGTSWSCWKWSQNACAGSSAMCLFVPHSVWTCGSLHKKTQPFTIVTLRISLYLNCMRYLKYKNNRGMVPFLNW